MDKFIITDLEGKQVVHQRFDTKIEANKVLDALIENRVDLGMALHIGLSEDTLRALERNEYVIRTEVIGELNV